MEENNKIQLALLTSDNDFRTYLSIQEEFQVLYKTNDLEEEIQEEICIIDDQCIELNTLCENREQVKSKYVFYCISEENFRFSSKTILNKIQAYMIPPHYTLLQKIEYIKDTVFTGYKFKHNKNMITFFGADAKVGTTQVIQGVAEGIVKNTDLKVLLLNFNGNPSTNYFGNQFKGNIDSLKIKLMNQVININEIMDSCENIDNQLYILQGTNSLLYRREYQPEHLEYLTNALKGHFDLILIDGGTEVDLGMSISALLATNHRYLITAQSITNLDTYLRKKEILKILNLDDFSLILNKYTDEKVYCSQYDLARQYSQPYLSTIPRSRYGLQAEIDKKSIYSYGEVEYVKSIEFICGDILEKFGYQIEPKKKIKRMFALFSKGE